MFGALLALALPLFQAPQQGSPVTPDMGAMTGQGELTDGGGKPIGRWSVEAKLHDGDFTGNGTITIGAVTLTMPLVPQRSYLENGKCYFAMEQGRARAQIGGPCTTAGITGSLGGFIPEGEIYSITGGMRGTLAFSRAAAKAPARGLLPTSKLTCAWMERVGGNVAGDLPRYELRFSNMATLTLAANGTYRTANTSGRFVREGDRIRLTSGQFAGAVGRLEPDRSGTPAIYFERDENRRADGVHIVDPARTSCTVARGG